jgi:hypothetical protein
MATKKVTQKKESGVVNIRGKEYKTVALRVQEFQEWNEKEAERSYAIRTKIISRSNVEVCVKASIVDTTDGSVMATGHAEEMRRDGNVNRTSALENAETSAVGRALAVFGLGGSEFASANEVRGAMAQQAEKIKPEKVAAVQAYLDLGDITTDHLMQRFGHTDINRLLDVEADRIINALKGAATGEQ